MAIDLAKLKNRLSNLTSKNTARNVLWKPKGKHIIRIVPYKYNLENPFIELYFHYQLNGKTFLSPHSFSRPDPIVELANQLKKSGDKDKYQQGRKLEPKMRIYVPILVRGEEDQGVKFWGFGKQVYEVLLSIIADPDYGDITDLSKGRDISIEFKAAAEAGKSFPETAILVKPNQTPAFDIRNQKLVKAVSEDQKNILDIYPEPSYADLEAELEKFLAGPEEGAEGESSSDTATAGEDAGTDDSSEAGSTVTASPVAEKATVNQSEVAAQFEALFKKK
jgi:hypothetical protein